jgi:hypothetical protein
LSAGLLVFVAGLFSAGLLVAGLFSADLFSAGLLVAGALVAGALVAGALVAGALVAGALVAGALAAGLLALVLLVLVFGASPPQAESNKATDATVDNVKTLSFIFVSCLTSNLVSNVLGQNFTILYKQVRDISTNLEIVKRKMNKNHQKKKIFSIIFYSIYKLNKTNRLLCLVSRCIRSLNVIFS